MPAHLRPDILYLTIREVLKLLAENGWYLVRTRGSHPQFKHPTKSGLVTVAGKASDEIALSALSSLLKPAGLK